MSVESIRNLIDTNRIKVNEIVEILNQLNMDDYLQRSPLFNQCKTKINVFIYNNDMLEDQINQLKEGPDKNEFNEYLFLFKTNNEEFTQHLNAFTQNINEAVYEKINAQLDDLLIVV